MHSTYPYSTSVRQQPPAQQWVYKPSFYNGYSTHLPLNINHPQQFVKNYISPIEQQQIYQPSSLIPTPNQSSMKSFNLIRNAFSFSNFHQTSNDDNEYVYHEQQLNRNLFQSGFERLPVKGDGNCLFYALAEGLMYEMKSDPNGFGLKLRQLFRLAANFRLVDFADRLRKLCVEQWRSYEDYYSQFIDKEKVVFLKEVKKFSKNGVSDSTLGDIVPLTVANALNINITIFTSVSNLPRIDVKPAHKNNSSSSSNRKTVYLAYNQYGIGHYDAAYPRV